MKLKLLKPFNNRKGGGTLQIVGLILAGIALVTLISWVSLRGVDDLAKSRANTLCYRLADAIAETGEVNDAIQDDLYKSFNKLKGYTGDYTIEYYKYNYKSYGSKVYIGTSKNGSKVPKTSIDRGDIIHVVFKSSKTPLDELSKILDGSTTNVGLAAEHGMKVQ